MNEKNINDIIKDAFELEKNEQYKSAIELLYKGLDIEPDNEELLAQIAELYRKLKNYEISKEYALKAVKSGKSLFAQTVLVKNFIETTDTQSFQEFIKNTDLSTSDADLINTIFQGFIKFNLYQDAINLYQQIQNQVSNNPETLYYFALCNYFVKEYETAEKLAKKVLELNTNDLNTRILLANIAYKNNDYQTIKSLFEQVKDEDKTDHAYYILGLVELNEQQYQKAVDYFSKSLSLNKNNKNCLYALANSYYFLGWLDEALKALAKAKLLAPNDIEILYLNAEIYFLQNKFEYAIPLISSILQEDKNNVNAKILKANIYIKKELYVMAQNILQEILSQDAENIEALKLYYDVCQNLGWHQKSLTTLEKILLLEPENTDYLCKLAQAFCTLEKWQDAKTVLNKIFAISSNYEIAYELALNIYFHLKEYDEACDIADKWLQINPNSDYAHFVLAQIFAEKDYDEALKEILSALQLNPTCQKYYIVAANIYEAKQDYTNAYQYYCEAFEINANKELAQKMLSSAIIQNDEQLTEKTFNKIRKFAPHDIDLAFLYADYLYERAYPKKALEILKILCNAVKDKDLKAIVKAKIDEIK